MERYLVDTHTHTHTKLDHRPRDHKSKSRLGRKPVRVSFYTKCLKKRIPHYLYVDSVKNARGITSLSFQSSKIQKRFSQDQFKR